MKLTPPDIPKKFMPRGFQIIHEDRDLIIGNKAPGLLTVAALWEKSNTVHALLNQYVRKGSSASRKVVHVVHRLDQATSGVLIFAKSEEVQVSLKSDWKNTIKTYLCVVHGKLAKKSGLISSYLSEDEDYVVHQSDDNEDGKLAKTEYKVLSETQHLSLLQVNLLTGRKNQIRVHMQGHGHSVVGDAKYGDPKTKYKQLMLHASAIEFTHPFKKERLRAVAPVPEYFQKILPYNYEA